MRVPLTHRNTIVVPLLLGLSLSHLGCTASLPNSTVVGKEPPPSPSPSATATVTPSDRAMPRYQHIFVMVEENKGYGQIIGNPDLPVINQLAKTYGLATRFYGEVHPSEANYIAMLGGSTFGIHDDDAYYCQAGSQEPFCGNAQQPGYANHTITARSLIDQLEEKGLTWKGYFEDLPAPGSKVVVAPDLAHALYAVKHNGFLNFKRVQADPNLAQKIVGLDQLAIDLKSGKVPNYSHIILNQCHEMHGLNQCRELRPLLKTADRKVGEVVQLITQSKSWQSAENVAIVLTWDEDNSPPLKTEPQGCCGFEPRSAANFGGGHIPTLVITNHGPRGVADPTPYNHYSLLRTIEDAFGINEYLNFAKNTAQGVQPMLPLWAVGQK